MPVNCMEERGTKHAFFPPQPSVKETMIIAAWEDFNWKLKNADPTAISKVTDVLKYIIKKEEGKNTDDEELSHIYERCSGKERITHLDIEDQIFYSFIEKNADNMLRKNAEKIIKDKKSYWNFLNDARRYLNRISGDKTAMLLDYPGRGPALDIINRLHGKPESLEDFCYKIGIFYDSRFFSKAF